MTVLVGITGGIGCGKSTISQILKTTLYFPVIDMDSYTDIALAKNSEVYNDIVKYFGKEILNYDKTINRNMLSNVVFNNEEKRSILDSITHPYIKKLHNDALSNLLKITRSKIVFVEHPLLYEKNSAAEFDKVIVVYTSPYIQIRRVMYRNTLRQLNLKQAISRVNAQLPLSVKINSADFVVDNSQDVKFTLIQVYKIVHNIINEK